MLKKKEADLNEAYLLKEKELERIYQKKMEELEKEIADKLLNKVNINILTESCKNICTGCNQKCLYTLEEIKSKNIKMIKAELKAHSHPTSRMINGLARNKEQSIKELCFHYKNNHNQN